MEAHQATRVRRRTLLAGAGALIAAGTAVAQTPPSGTLIPSGAPVAATRAGQVYGLRVDGINVFKGVRYGATTEGRRFLPPQAPSPWPNARPALDFGNHAPQLGADRPSVYDSWSNPRPESEDCLVLNVYTAGLRDGRPRPVMVWFHGGGYTSGSASSHYADGTRLARRNDVVVVTVNHRLNAFGHLYVGHLGGAEYADSGNAGALDMVLALQWVRDNIAEFGGDAGNVLIFGQLGGGGKVSTLMAMPAAAGLFHKAVVQSGSGITAIERPAAEATTRRVMTALNVQPTDLAGLRAVSRAALSAALVNAGGAFGPVMDGRALPRHPFEPDAPAVSRGVPLLVGSVKDETTSLVGGRDAALFSITWEQLPQRLGSELGRLNVAAVIAELRRLNPTAKPSDVYFTATSEYRFRRRSILQAERKAAQAAAGGAPVFMYAFDWETPVDGGKWKSPHSVEHAMVFDNVAVSASMVGTGPNAQRVADAVSQAWVRFARTGNPGWSAYTPDRRTTMVFDVQSRVVDDHRRAERVLFAAG